MKEEALKLAVWLENMSKLGWADNFGQELDEISAMIRRLVEELDKHKEMLEKHQDIIADWDKKPLSDEEILHIYSESYRNTLMGIDPLVFAREIEERHGIK